MTAALRNISGNTASRKILGTPWNGLLAEQIAAETAVGDNGEGALYNESIDPTYAGKRLSMHVTSWPGVGSLRVEENGAIDASGFPDGVYVVPYDVYVDGAFDSSSSFTLTFGTVDGTVSGGTGTGVGAGSGGDATGVLVGSVSGGTGAGTGVGSGGDATGVTAGDGSVTGGTGTGTGSGSGGDATGQIAGDVSGGTGVGIGSGSGGDATGLSADGAVSGGTGTGSGSGSGGLAVGVNPEVITRPDILTPIYAMLGEPVTHIPLSGSPSVGLALHSTPGAELFSGELLTTDHALRYARASFPSVQKGDAFTIDGISYIARESAQSLLDGKECMVPLARAA